MSKIIEVKNSEPSIVVEFTAAEVRHLLSLTGRCTYKVHEGLPYETGEINGAIYDTLEGVSRSVDYTYGNGSRPTLGR